LDRGCGSTCGEGRRTRRIDKQGKVCLVNVREAVANDQARGNETVPGLAGDAQRRAALGSSLASRAWSWLAWWIVLMAIWVIVDYSISVDELLAGAGAAFLAAFLVEVATWQAAVRFGAQIGWLAPALRLPGQVLRTPPPCSRRW
jgi:hypothetical protein